MLCWITFYQNYIYANIKYLLEWIEFFHNNKLEILNKAENKNCAQLIQPGWWLVDLLTLEPRSLSGPYRLRPPKNILEKRWPFISKVLLRSQDIRSPTGTVLIDARRGAVVYRVEDNVTGLSFAVVWTPPDGDGPGPLVREKVNNFRRKWFCKWQTV